VTINVLTFNWCSQATTKEKGCKKFFFPFSASCTSLLKLAWTQIFKRRTGFREKRVKCQKYPEKLYHNLSAIY